MSPPDDGDGEPSETAPPDGSPAPSEPPSSGDSPHPGEPASSGDPSPPDDAAPPDDGDDSPPDDGGVGHRGRSDGDRRDGSVGDDAAAGESGRAGGGNQAGTTDRGTVEAPGVGADVRTDAGGETGGGTGELREVDDAANEDEGEPMDWRTFAYDVANSAVAVLLVGALLFAVSGVWPPMVAVESPSMTPQMQTGDLVFVMEETRFPGEGAQEGTGVVTARAGETTDADYRKFQRQGDVIVYEPRGNGETTPIIHRAMFWVNESENWYEKADKQAVGRYDACGETQSEALPNCPAPHDGFVTKGDANARYDQVDELSGPVKPAWVVGTAEVRVPLLGCIRLRSERCANGVLGTVGPATPPGCERCRVPTPGSARLVPTGG